MICYCSKFYLFRFLLRNLYWKYMNCYMYYHFYWYTGDSYMIFGGHSFFPQILQNIKSVLRQKYSSYDILYSLIRDNSNTLNRSWSGCFSCSFNDHLQNTSKLIKTNKQISVRSLNVSNIEVIFRLKIRNNWC